MPTNLWPDFDLGQVPRSPKTVIEEAGAGLEEKTKGQVKFYPLGTQIDGSQVILSFSLYVRKLAYHYPFLRAQFSIANMYPVSLSVDKINDKIVAADEAELIGALERIFHDITTVETVKRLLSISQ